MSAVPLKTCRNCGMTWKWKHYCPAEDNTCKSCGKIGHVAKRCRSSKQKDEHGHSRDDQDWRRNNNRNTANTEDTPPSESSHDNNSYRNHHRHNFHHKVRNNSKEFESRRVDVDGGKWRETTKNPKVFSKIKNSRTSRNDCNENWRVRVKNNKTDDDKKRSSNLEGLKNWRRESTNARTNVRQPGCDSGKNNANSPTDDDCSKFTGIGDKSKPKCFHQEQKKYDAIRFRQKLAKLCYDRGNYEYALSQYSRLIELCPDDPKNFNNRSACHMMMEQYDDAVADAKKVIQLDPSCVKGYERVIKCEILLGHTIPAKTYLGKLSQIDPENKLITIEHKKLDELQGHLENEKIAVKNENNQNALECINEYLMISPQCLSHKIKKAGYLISLNRQNEAQQILNEILMKVPLNVDAKYIMGLCLYHSDIDEALKHFKEILRLDPDYSVCLEIYEKTRRIVELKETGNNEFKSGNFSAAHDIYSSAILIDPDNTLIKMRLLFNMGQASYHSANFERAIKEYSQALEIDSNLIKALKQRGKCYMKMKDYEEAIADFSRVCSLEPRSEFQKLIDDVEKMLASVNKDVYTILGVNRDSSIEEVKKA